MHYAIPNESEQVEFVITRRNVGTHCWLIPSIFNSRGTSCEVLGYQEFLIGWQEKDPNNFSLVILSTASSTQSNQSNMALNPANQAR